MWKYRGVSYFLVLYGLIGITLFVLIEMTSLYELVFCLLVYCVIPLYCAFGIWQKKQHAIALALIPFILQSIRYVGSEAMIPSFSPITISFPLTSFEQGTGYLIDYLAITMLCVLIYLFGENKSKPSS